jgi:23S rRNA (adenine2030-N6)-methyltransferase
MNYRHSYHAGNFADVLKHAVFALVLEYMKRKEAPFRVIDTHAGAGRYALTSPQAEKTGEWQGGIGRLIGPDAKPLAPGMVRHLRPYLDAVRRENAGGALAIYPGSPALALSLMRPQDTLVANELRPEERLLAATGGPSSWRSTPGLRSRRCCRPRSAAA